MKFYLETKKRKIEITSKSKAKALQEKGYKVTDEKGKDVKTGDKVVVSSENLCTARNKTKLKCDIILCYL